MGDSELGMGRMGRRWETLSHSPQAAAAALVTPIKPTFICKPDICTSLLHSLCICYNPHSSGEPHSTLFLLQHFTDTRGRACEEFHIEICFVPAVREGGMTEEGTWASSTSWQNRRWKPRLNLMLTQSSSSTGGN